MSLRGLLRGPRFRSAALVTVTATTLITSVVRSEGFRNPDVQLHDGGVWITRSQPFAQLGRLNTQIASLDAALALPGDLHQSGETVLVHDAAASQLTVVDVRLQKPTSVPVPAGAQVRVGGTTTAVLAAGKLWMLSGDAVATFDERNAPTAVLPTATDLAVGVDGTAHVLTVKDHAVHSFDPDGRGPAVRPLAGPIEGDPQLSAVGAVPVVVLGAQPARVFVGSAEPLLLPDSVAVLQQPGPDSEDVLVAVSDRLLAVPLSGGEPRALVSGQAGAPVAPVLLKGCAYAAWQSRPTLAQACSRNKPLVKPLRPQYDKLVFRTNRDRVLLNEMTTGVGLLLEDDGEVVEVRDWEQALRVNGGEGQLEDDAGQEVVVEQDTEVENKPPQAEPDSVGTRPGRPVVVRPLDNDLDPNGDVLALEAFPDLPEGTVEIIDGGQAVQWTPEGRPSGPVVFEYTVEDGRGLRDTSTITITTHDEATNGPPVVKQDALTVESGKTTTVDLLDNDSDPEGDGLRLDEVRVPAGVVQWRETGEITYTAPGGGAQKLKATYVVVDDRGEPAEGVLEITVTEPARNLPPIAVGDRIDGLTGATLNVDLLANDRDPNADELSVTHVAEAPDLALAWTPDGQLSVSSNKPHPTRVLRYEVSDGVATDTAFVRIDIRAPEGVHPPVAVRDDVVLRPGVPVLVPVLDNDVDLDGDVLVLQTVENVPAPLTVEVVEHRYLRVSSPSPLTGTASLAYRVSDGNAQAVGRVFVQPGEQSSVDQPPITGVDRASVRTNGVTSVPVLENDLDPEGGLLTLLSVAAPAVGDGAAFVQGGELRYAAPDRERGAVRLRYTVRDEAGNKADGTLQVRVLPSDAALNTAPAPRPIEVRTLSGKEFRIPVPLLGIDPEGDAVALLGHASPPQLGAVIDKGSDFLLYRAPRSGGGTDRFTYRVQDSFGAEALGTVLVGIAPAPEANSPPVALPDEATVAAGETVRITPLRNDSDPDEDPLNLLPGDRAVTQPRAGEVQVAGSALEFRAPADLVQEEQVTFDYSITDGRGGTARGVVTVTVTSAQKQGLSPIAVDDLVPAQRAGAKVSVDVLANDEDPDGDVRAATVKVTGGVTTTTSGGTVSFVMPSEAVSLTYVLTDAQGLTAQAVIQTPLLANLPPVAGADTATGEVGKPVRVPVLGNDSDPEGQPLSITRVLGVFGGTATVDGEAVVFTPAASAVTGARFTYEVTDGVLRSLGSVSVEVAAAAATNTPPTFTSTVVDDLASGEERTIDLARLVVDPDSGALHSFSTLTGTTREITASLRGSSLTVRAATGAGAGKTATLRVQVDDGQGGTATGEVLVRTVATSAAPPQASADTGRSVDAKPITLAVLQNDLDPIGSGLTIASVSSAGAAGSASHDGRTVTFNPARGFSGAASFSYVARDVESRQTTGSVTVDVVARPAAPPVPTGRVASRSATLTWGVPPANGAPIREYVLEHDSGGTQRCPSNTCAVGQLTNGQDYRFRVRAVNEAGEGEFSGWSAVLTPDQLPGAPDAPTTAFGDKSVTVRWTAPANEGSALKEYVLAVNPPSAGTAAQTLPPGTTTFVWPRLSNGTAYSFRVTAVNKAGAGEPSAFSAPQVPAGVPAAPAAPTAVRADGEVAVSWAEPDGNGDRPKSYTLSIRENGRELRTLKATTTSARVPASNGQSYTFVVTATNKAGTSQPSAASTAVVPAGVPKQVGTVQAEPADAAAVLAFSAPDANGAPITGYKISGGGSGAPTMDKTVRGLTNGQPYRFTVAACNVVGCGAPSGSTPEVVPFGTPNAPSVTASVQGRTITWNWNTPDGNGRPLRDFTVTLDGHHVQGGLGTSFSREFGYGENHVVQVAATNTGGKTSPTGTAGASTVPAPSPKSISLSKGRSAVGLPGCTHASCAFIRVELRNFAPNRSYTVSCREGSSEFYNYSTSTNGDGSSVSERCYYGFPGKTVTVVVDGVSANLRW